MILAWQRELRERGGTKKGKPLSANSVRLTQASLAGAMKLAVERGLLRSNPLTSVPRLRPKRSVVPKHWTPEDAPAFLRSQERDRLYPLWAFLLGSGVRIGELVWLRWPNVDLAGRRVRIVEVATTRSAGIWRPRTAEPDGGANDRPRRRPGGDPSPPAGGAAL